MKNVITIGAFEFAAAPGQIIRRRRPRTWYSAIFFLIVAMLALIDRSYWHAAFWCGTALLQIMSAAAHKRDDRDPTPLMEQRDGRWIVREADAGPIKGADAFVKQDGDRWLVLLSWPQKNERPFLVWWTKKRSDADRLWDLIATILPDRSESDRKPVPAALDTAH